jgi:hypothetical protein
MQGKSLTVPMLFLLMAAALTAFASMTGYLLLGVQGAIEGAKAGLVIAFLVIFSSVMWVAFSGRWKAWAEAASLDRSFREELVGHLPRPWP